MRFTAKHIVALIGLALVTSTAAMAEDAAKPLKNKPDESWVSLSGTVVEQGKDYLLLDYGQGIVTVELDRPDSFSRTTINLENDKVTVFGKVDKDFYQSRSIEADTVYMASANTVIYDPSPKDEEELKPASNYVPGEYEFYVSGTVTSVSGRTFTLDIGSDKITVDTSALPYNPMDDKGFQQISEGDFVTVSAAQVGFEIRH